VESEKTKPVLAAMLALALVGGCSQHAASPRPGDSIAEAERLYLAARDLADELDVAEARGAVVGTSGRELAELERSYADALTAAQRAVEAASARDPEDQRARERMREALRSEVRAPASPNAAAAPPDESPGSDSCLRPAQLASLGGAADALSSALYTCFGDRATRIEFEGETIDRLTVFARLASEPDAANRQRLFRSFLPLWKAIDGEPGTAGPHPYRELVRRGAADWRAEGSPIDRQLRALGFDPLRFEADLEQVLEAWRQGFGVRSIEPWDLHWENGAASRALATAVPRDRLEEIHRRFYADLGADPVALGVRYDLAPREGKTPVAFCTFGRRGRTEGGAWRPTEPWVFATYRAGGFDNLIEILHETGHAVHLSAIRTRPAFLDWPDADAFTEGVADLFALEAYEPEWQERYLGTSVPLADALRSKYGGIAMDIAWALFEIRMHREPAREPNELWSAMMERYFGIRPHPELSWWALRGQLVSNPGYMANYAIGAVLVADLRAEERRRNGPLFVPDPERYRGVADALFRPGRERSSRAVIERFLGRSPSVDALLADLRRARVAAESGPAAYLPLVSSTSAK
jgi:hypothetical protein